MEPLYKAGELEIGLGRVMVLEIQLHMEERTFKANASSTSPFIFNL